MEMKLSNCLRIFTVLAMLLIVVFVFCSCDEPNATIESAPIESSEETASTSPFSEEDSSIVGETTFDSSDDTSEQSDESTNSLPEESTFSFEETPSTEPDDTSKQSEESEEPVSKGESTSSLPEESSSSHEDTTSQTSHENSKKSKGSSGLVFKTNSKDKSTCSLVGIGTCTDSTIIIPEYSPSGEKVIKIADNAFSGCKELPHKIVIPNTVEEIGGWLFPLGTIQEEEFILEFGSSVKKINGTFLTFDANDHITHVIYHGTEADFAKIKHDVVLVGGKSFFLGAEHHYIIEGNDFTYKYYVANNGSITYE